MGRRIEQTFFQRGNADGQQVYEKMLSREMRIKTTMRNHLTPVRMSSIKKNMLGPGALGRPRGIGWRGRWEGGSGWGIHVTPWLIHVNV